MSRTAEQGDRAAQLLAQAFEVADTSKTLPIFGILKIVSTDSSKDFAVRSIANGYAEIGQRKPSHSWHKPTRLPSRAIDNAIEQRIDPSDADVVRAKLNWYCYLAKIAIGY